MLYATLKEELSQLLLCRSCINELHQIKLTQEDCLYRRHLHPCMRCGEMKNIVRGVRFFSHHLVWSGKVSDELTNPPKDAE